LMGPTAPPADPRALARGRLCVVLAAVLWSTSGAFTKLLTQPTALGLHEPPLEPFVVGSYRLPVQIGFYRVLFARLVLLTTLRPRELGVRRVMVVMAGSFAVMNILYISAQALGPAANAVLLQYTAPMWMYLASVWWLGEPADRRGAVTLVLGLAGVAV